MNDADRTTHTNNFKADYESATSITKAEMQARFRLEILLRCTHFGSVPYPRLSDATNTTLSHFANSVVLAAFEAILLTHRDTKAPLKLILAETITYFLDREAKSSRESANILEALCTDYPTQCDSIIP